MYLICIARLKIILNLFFTYISTQILQSISGVLLANIRVGWSESLRNDDFLILSAHTLTESHPPRTEKRFRLFLPFPLSLSLMPLDDSHSALNVRYNVSAITFARTKIVFMQMRPVLLARRFFSRSWTVSIFIALHSYHSSLQMRLCISVMNNRINDLLM